MSKKIIYKSYTRARLFNTIQCLHLNVIRQRFGRVCGFLSAHICTCRRMGSVRRHLSNALLLQNLKSKRCFCNNVFNSNNKFELKASKSTKQVDVWFGMKNTYILQSIAVWEGSRKGTWNRIKICELHHWWNDLTKIECWENILVKSFIQSFFWSMIQTIRSKNNRPVFTNFWPNEEDVVPRTDSNSMWNIFKPSCPMFSNLAHIHHVSLILS